MTKEVSNLERFGEIVRLRREELGLRQDQLSEGPSTTALTGIENGRSKPAPVTLRKLDASLRWEPGSAKRTLAGGDPTPMPVEMVTPASLSDSNPGPGLRPGSLAASMVLSTRERQILARVRNKLVNQSALTPEEHLLLTKFVEDEELRTLHVRIDWLPRAEQLEVSSLVNDLHMRIENRRIADGPGLVVPDYAEPNPLPRDGMTPDQLEEDEDDYALPSDQTAPSGASPETVKDEEASLDDASEPSVLGLMDDDDLPSAGEQS